MSDAEQRNNERQNNELPGKKEDLPTASFSGSAPVVVHRTSGSIRPFDFFSMNDYSTGVLAKRDNKE